jgi:hypothetical protein
MVLATSHLEDFDIKELEDNSRFLYFFLPLSHIRALRLSKLAITITAKRIDEA